MKSLRLSFALAVVAAVATGYLVASSQKNAAQAKAGCGGASCCTMEKAPMDCCEAAGAAEATHK